MMPIRSEVFSTGRGPSTRRQRKRITFGSVKVVSVACHSQPDRSKCSSPSRIVQEDYLSVVRSPEGILSPSTLLLCDDETPRSLPSASSPGFHDDSEPDFEIPDEVSFYSQPVVSSSCEDPLFPPVPFSQFSLELETVSSSNKARVDLCGQDASVCQAWNSAMDLNAVEFPTDYETSESVPVQQMRDEGVMEGSTPLRAQDALFSALADMVEGGKVKGGNGTADGGQRCASSDRQESGLGCEELCTCTDLPLSVQDIGLAIDAVIGCTPISERSSPRSSLAPFVSGTSPPSLRRRQRKRPLGMMKDNVLPGNADRPKCDSTWDERCPKKLTLDMATPQHSERWAAEGPMSGVCSRSCMTDSTANHAATSVSYRSGGIGRERTPLSLSDAPSAATCTFCGRRCESVGVGVSALPTNENSIQHHGLEFHLACALWCPEVYYERSRRTLVGVEEAYARCKHIKCAYCRGGGAGIGCVEERCQLSYHPHCARLARATMDPTTYQMWCPKHAFKHHKRGRDIACQPSHNSVA